jgi:uronate dehydrogenase
VLITGSGGLVGSILYEGLRDEHQVRGIDVRRADRVDTRVDMRRLDRVVDAFAGVDTVIDLAANADSASSWPDVHANNLPVTINTLEAAARTGVRRVIFGSSNHVNGLAERDEPYASILAGRRDGLDPQAVSRVRVDDPVRPDGPYGYGKVLGEAAGRHFAEEYGISVLCLRLGTVNPANRPANPRHRATLLSHRDLVGLVRACVAAPETLRFGIYFGVSANTWRIWDIENVQRELGYEPLDDVETWP